MAAQLQLDWGRACLEQSDYEATKAHLNAALSYFQEQKNSPGMAEAHYHLSHMLMEQDQHDAAEEEIQLAWQAYQADEDVRGMGRALFRLGNIVYHRGDYERSITLANDAIQSQEEVGDQLGLLRSHMLATSAYLQLQEYDSADSHCQSAKRLVTQVDNKAETAIFYYTYADVLRKQQAFTQAQEMAQQALTLFSKMSDSNNEVNALMLLAGIEINWNDAEPARKQVAAGLVYCDEALVLCHLIGYGVGQAFLSLMTGRLLHQANRHIEACQTWREGLALADKLDHQWLQQRLQQLINENCYAV